MIPYHHVILMQYLIHQLRFYLNLHDAGCVDYIFYDRPARYCHSDLLFRLIRGLLIVSLPHADEGNYDAGDKLQESTDRKPVPLIIGALNDGGDDDWADERRNAVGDAKQSEEHVLVARGNELGHHGLSVGVEGGSEQAKPNLVEPEFPDILKSQVQGWAKSETPPNGDEECGHI